MESQDCQNGCQSHLKLKSDLHFLRKSIYNRRSLSEIWDGAMERAKGFCGTSGFIFGHLLATKISSSWLNLGFVEKVVFEQLFTIRVNVLYFFSRAMHRAVNVDNLSIC